MLKVGFYSKFKNYKYMLLVQTDALIFRDEAYLDKLISENEYDYWGAPWKCCYEVRKFDWTFYNKWLCHFDSFIKTISPVLKCKVGNGGLTLRNIHAVVMPNRNLD